MISQSVSSRDCRLTITRALYLFFIATLIAASLSLFFPVHKVGAVGGAYTVKLYAADARLNRGPYLPTYSRLTPAQYLALHSGVWPPQLQTSAGGGLGVGDGTVLYPHAVAYSGPLAPSTRDAVTSLEPSDMKLGQIVPFEFEIVVNGNTTPENGSITFAAVWNCTTTSGRLFGFDPAWGVVGAFVDEGDPCYIVPTPGGGPNGLAST